MSPIRPEQRFDLVRWLRDVRGLRLRTTPDLSREYVDRHRHIRTHDAIVTTDAGRVAIIHLRGAEGWWQPADGEAIAEWVTAEPGLHELDAVEAVLVRAGPDRVRMFSRRGSMLIERTSQDGEKRYRVVAGQDDPIGYQADQRAARLMDGGWHGSREWLQATAHTRFPDLVPQAVELFDSPRSGDVVVLAAGEWSLSGADHGGHGSCTLPDMRIPLHFAGPGLPGGVTLATARLVDVMPTVLGLLGESHRLDAGTMIDGIDLTPLLQQLQAPGSAGDMGSPATGM